MTESKPVIVMSTIGVLPPYTPSDDVEVWIRTYKSFLVANGLKIEDNEDRCRAILLSTIGIPMVSTITSLVAPELPEKKKLQELLDVLTKHFKPPPKAIAERFTFTGRKQHRNESISEFLAALRKLASTCKFEGNLEERIRDQFVFGLISESAQRKIFTLEDNVTLTEVVAKAQAQELAEKSTTVIRGNPTQVTPEDEVLRITTKHERKYASGSSAKPSNFKKKALGRRQCQNCGSSSHSHPKDCPHKSVVCHGCGKKGHFVKMCRSKSKPQSAHNTSLDINTCKPMIRNRIPKITIEVTINGIPHTMEFDTGCEQSLLSSSFFRQMLPTAKLKPTPITFKTYTNQIFKPIGEVSVAMVYNGQSKPVTIPVGAGTSLFGRDLLKMFSVDWHQIQLQCNNVGANTRSLSALLKEYSDVFGEPKGKIKGFRAKILMKDDAVPRFMKARPIPYALEEKVNKELDLMLQQGVISKISHSEWASPLVVVPKPNGRVRITGDFKNTVNSQLHVTQYPIANPEKLLIDVGQGEKYSKLDGANAYHQMEVDEASKKYLVINTHRGLYRYNVLPQGIASAPAIYQEFADALLQGIPRCGSYLDDSLCTGKNDTEHLEILSRIFERMREFNFYLSRDKCELMRSHVTFLGNVLSSGGIHVDPKKVEVISSITTPKNVHELKSFLGLVNFYNRFSQEFADVCSPLYSLTEKGATWSWSKVCSQAFARVKQILSNAPVLTHFHHSLPIGLSCDASSRGLGVVLFHRVSENGKAVEKPIAFASRKLTKTEMRYGQIEREALSIVFGVRKFYKFLCGKRFILVTDHKPLLAIFGPKVGLQSFAASRLHRWCVFLGSFDYTIEYRRTNDHGNADALSRFPHDTNFVEEDEAAHEVHIIACEAVENLPVTASAIRNMTTKDSLLSQVIRYMTTAWPNEIQKSDPLHQYFVRRHELKYEMGVLLWGIRAIIPKPLQRKILNGLHAAHTGIVRMKSLAREYFWWPGLDSDIELQCKTCEPCCSVQNNPSSAPLHPWKFPERPWQRLHVDLAGPFMGRTWLVIVDAHSKWPEVFELTSGCSSESVILKLREVMCRFGIPDQIVSDNGRQFVAAEFQEFCKRNQIRHSTSSIYHPRTNGEAERFIQTFKKSMQRSEGAIATRLQRFLFTYRLTPHATTGASPASLLLKQKPRSLLDMVKPDVSENVLKSQDRQQHSYNKHVKYRDFMVGEDVWVRTFGKYESKWSLGKVLRSLGPVTYLVQVADKSVKRHADQIHRAQKLTLTPAATVSANDPASPVSLQSETFRTPPSSPEKSDTSVETISPPTLDGPFLDTSVAASRPRRGPKPIERYGSVVSK